MFSGSPVFSVLTEKNNRFAFLVFLYYNIAVQQDLHSFSLSEVSLCMEKTLKGACCAAGYPGGPEKNLPE